MRVSVEAVDTPQVVTDGERAEIMLGSERVLTNIPWALRHEEEEAAPSDEKASKRTHDYLLPEAATVVHVYKLYPPAQYQVAELPASAKDTLGPLTFSRNYKRGPDGEVDVEYRAEIGKRRWTAEECEKVRDGLRKLSGSLTQTIHFVPATAELVATGEFGKAIAMVRDDVAKHADMAGAHIRYSRLLVTLGMGKAARAEALKATELDKESGQAWQALAWAWQNDTFGRLRQGDWSRVRALEALRKATKSDAEDMVAKMDLAILLEFNNEGERYGQGEDLAEAATLYREVLKKGANAVVETNLTASLFYAGKYDEAKQEFAKCPDVQRIVFGTALLAMQEGAAKAIVNLQSSVPDTTQRPQLLVGAALVLTHALKYQEANAMMQAAQRLVNSAQLGPMTQMLARAKPYEESMLPTIHAR